jgi:hypothetical protein
MAVWRDRERVNLCQNCYNSRQAKFSRRSMNCRLRINCSESEDVRYAAGTQSVLLEQIRRLSLQLARIDSQAVIPAAEALVGRRVNAVANPVD